MNEEKLFNKFVKLNPTPGVKHPEYMDKLNSHSYRYFIPNWLKSCGDNWYYVSHKKIVSELNNLGLNIQIYYDICILGLTKIEDRPKCNLFECNNSKFYNLNQGYQKYCCKSHQVMDKNRHISDSTGEKLRESGRKHIVLDKDRYTLSNIIKNNPEIRKKQLESRNKTYLKRKIERGVLDENGNKIIRKKTRRAMSEEARLKMPEIKKKFYKDHPEKIHVNGFKRFNNKTGYEFSNKKGIQIRYLSSWEQKFIRFIDKSNEISKIYDMIPILYYNPEKLKDSYYFADFYLELSDGVKVLIEIKPHRLVDNKIVALKRNAALDYCKSNGIYYITLTERELFLSDRTKNSSEFNNNLNIHECISSQYCI